MWSTFQCNRQVHVPNIHVFPCVIRIEITYDPAQGKFVLEIEGLPHKKKTYNYSAVTDNISTFKYTHHSPILSHPPYVLVSGGFTDRGYKGY